MSDDLREAVAAKIERTLALLWAGIVLVELCFLILAMFLKAT